MDFAIPFQGGLKFCLTISFRATLLLVLSLFLHVTTTCIPTLSSFISSPVYIYTCLLCCIHVVSLIYLTWHFKPNKYNGHSCVSWSPHLKRTVLFCHWAVFLQPSYDQLCNYKTAWMTWTWKSLLSLPSIWLNILRHTGSLRLTLYVSCPVMVPAFWVLNNFLWVLGFVCLSCLIVCYWPPTL